MLILTDKKISRQAKNKLSNYGDLLELETEGITYPAISGHPDIFFCQMPGRLVVAPNLPEQYIQTLNARGIDYIRGALPVGHKYPASARYNAVATDAFFIHNLSHSDPALFRSAVGLKPIHVGQGYTRCNLVPLKDGHFITSDRGIYRIFQGWSPSGEGLHPCSLFINPHKINLEGFPHGFFGGCCGVWENKVFINGSLEHFSDGAKVRDYLGSLNYEIIELDEGPLSDVGSILFVR
jgi:hypothetical protein